MQKVIKNLGKNLDIMKVCSLFILNMMSLYYRKSPAKIMLFFSFLLLVFCIYRHRYHFFAKQVGPSSENDVILHLR